MSEETPIESPPVDMATFLPADQAMLSVCPLRRLHHLYLINNSQLVCVGGEGVGAVAVLKHFLQGLLQPPPQPNQTSLFLKHKAATP